MALVEEAPRRRGRTPPALSTISCKDGGHKYPSVESNGEDTERAVRIRTVIGQLESSGRMHALLLAVARLSNDGRLKLSAAMPALESLVEALRDHQC